MSWKLTIDVIFNSFPLIKNKNLIPFIRHCERNMEILRLQPRHCERSNDFKGAVEKKSRESNVSRGKWTFQCKHWKFLGVYGQKNARTQRN